MFKQKLTLALLPMAVLLTGPAHSQDVAAGEKVFAKCKACHVADTDQNKVGPSLLNVFGRTAGTHEGFKYSPAMVEAGQGGLVWDEETLAKFLHNPKDMVPKTKMVFPGLKKEDEITNLLAYLKQFSN
ncbi:cytochrome c family protein [Chelativorans composti]|jgi:Cytochrome c2|nr:cytochrome c family protein [bacterium SGD-2]